MDASSPVSPVKVKDAIRVAKQFVIDIYGDTALQDVLLEEVRPDGNSWLITIGFRDPAASSPSPVTSEPLDRDDGPWSARRGPGFVRWPRVYKVVRVDGNVGRAVEMTSRAA